jgi:acyl-CoA thioesterase FadM
MMLLAELTAHIDRIVHVGDSCTIIGWALGTDGRKHHAGTALYNEDGELCARAQALWIEPREPK